jgi:hypothetical protein
MTADKNVYYFQNSGKIDKITLKAKRQLEINSIKKFQQLCKSSNKRQQLPAISL